MRTQGTYYIRGTEGRKDGRTDGRTDGRMEGRNAENYVPPLFFEKAGDNKTTDYSNFVYPKISIFQSDLSVPIKEFAIKLPFKIRSPNVTHDNHDFFVWSSSIYTLE